ncbi:MAG: HD domain-containing protein [Hyphomicrobiaceae bacterium]
MISASILKAADQAARWHEDQRRKGSKGEPYINHLLEVAALVAEAEPDNTDAIVAALLHDAMEDQPVTREQISGHFGKNVAAIVEECTDDKSLAKELRKQLQIETAAQKSRDAKLVKIADKTSNLRSIASSPPAHWPAERRRAYIDWSVAVVEAGLLGASAQLDARFEEAKIVAYRTVENDQSAPPAAS